MSAESWIFDILAWIIYLIFGGLMIVAAVWLWGHHKSSMMRRAEHVASQAVRAAAIEGEAADQAASIARSVEHALTLGSAAGLSFSKGQWGSLVRAASHEAQRGGES